MSSWFRCRREANGRLADGEVRRRRRRAREEERAAGIRGPEMATGTASVPARRLCACFSAPAPPSSDDIGRAGSLPTPRRRSRAHQRLETARDAGLRSGSDPGPGHPGPSPKRRRRPVNGIAITAAAPQPTQDRRAWTRLARIAVQLEDLAARLPPDMTLEDLEPARAAGCCRGPRGSAQRPFRSAPAMSGKLMGKLFERERPSTIPGTEPAAPVQRRALLCRPRAGLTTGTTTAARSSGDRTGGVESRPIPAPGPADHARPRGAWTGRQGRRRVRTPACRVLDGPLTRWPRSHRPRVVTRGRDKEQRMQMRRRVDQTDTPWMSVLPPRTRKTSRGQRMGCHPSH